MYMTMYDVVFGVFNLIPIPPLDGADVLAEFLPYKARVSYMKFSRYGMIVLLAMMVFGLFGYIVRAHRKLDLPVLRMDPRDDFGAF